MKLVCPFCGSDEFECFDRVGDGTLQPEDLCVCEECGEQFRILYGVKEIVKEG